MRRTLLPFLASLVLVAGVADAQEIMRAHYINVGQADATLLEFPCGAILIDAGAQDDGHITSLTDYLTDFFQGRTDLNNTLNQSSSRTTTSITRGRCGRWSKPSR